MRVKATVVESPITPVVFGLCSSLTAAPGLIPAVLLKAQARPPTIIWQSLEGWLIVETNLDYGNCMASMWVEWNGGGQAPLV